MFESFKNLLGRETERSASPAPKDRGRLMFHAWPSVVYAVGDVHGCLGLLKGLEDKIVRDAAGIEGEKWVVMLGDYVDRGPHSAQVIDHLLASPPDGFTRFCLKGNHEEVMLDFLKDPMKNPDWMNIGGAEATLASYGIDTARLDTALNLKRAIGAAIPQTHIAFLDQLPVLLGLPGTLFVHAGLRPGVPLDKQSDEDLLWFRPGTTDDAGLGVRVVHGHTPVRQAYVSKYRIDVDTGAFATGQLSAARLLPNGEVKILEVRV